MEITYESSMGITYESSMEITYESPMWISPVDGSSMEIIYESPIWRIVYGKPNKAFYGKYVRTYAESRKDISALNLEVFFSPRGLCVLFDSAPSSVPREPVCPLMIVIVLRFCQTDILIDFSQRLIRISDARNAILTVFVVEIRGMHTHECKGGRTLRGMYFVCKITSDVLKLLQEGY
ncbi:hypothetical protein CEXT_743681 [Caerostris extrusa]|uniref:Uncharacterized protein n=1 Tax=Caerostris extrusa TaxID=172846 RepID=A0AAV4NP81_CAEEX|nr:hypothetical protein CEXT_743681 [Caerostris extrusa]